MRISDWSSDVCSSDLKRETLGGTCLNVGCIPSKAMLQASEKFEEARDHLDGFGIKVGKVDLDLGGFMAHKDAVVKSNTQGVEFLFRKNKIDWLKGAGKIAGKGKIGRASCRERVGQDV